MKKIIIILAITAGFFYFSGEIPFLDKIRGLLGL